ncbi:MAG: KOW motif-containing protein [Planctomycetaceae bacterium]|nr:KOW motif-containing protein [Planctomycetaceae bacterium]
MRLWFVASLGLAFFLLYTTIDVTASALRSPVFLALGVLALIATTLLTLVISPFVAFLLFSGITERQGRRNGGPFGPGDRVLLIAGRNAGRSGVVTS